MGDVLQLPLPFTWKFTKRQLEEMDDATFESIRPVRPIAPKPAQEDWWHTQYEPYRKAQAKWEAEKRRRASVIAPHPNWANRKTRCAVNVEVEFGSKAAASWGYKLPHRARWERVHHSCPQPPVAWDGTDRRRTGYLYGACADHVRQAMADDPERIWFWTTGVVIDENFDLEAELVVLTLGGRTRKAFA